MINRLPLVAFPYWLAARDDQGRLVDPAELVDPTPEQWRRLAALNAAQEE